MTKYLVKVKPRSSQNKIVQAGEELTVWTTKSPHDGEANQAVIEQVAKFLKVPKTSIAIIRGAKSKTKLIKIN